MREEGLGDQVWQWCDLGCVLSRQLNLINPGQEECQIMKMKFMNNFGELKRFVIELKE